MSYKIKILAEDQYSSLMSFETPIGEEKIRLFLASLLPSLFYSASKKILNSGPGSFLYIPPDRWPENYSFGHYNEFSYKKFDLVPFEIEVGDNYFIPIISGNVIIGGLYGQAKEFDNFDRERLLRDYAFTDYLHHLSEVDSPSENIGDAAADFLIKMSAEESFDSFMRALPEWISDKIGGGTAALYYGDENSFKLRKVSGSLSGYEKMPSAIGGDEADKLVDAVSKKIMFSAMTELPESATELNQAPLIRFVFGGSIDNDFDYLLLGQLPDIISYRSYRYLTDLSQMLSKLSMRHFSSLSNWRQLFVTLDRMAGANSSRQELAVFLYGQLNEFIIINQVAIYRFFSLENRVEMEGLASSKVKAIRREKTFPISGTWYETVVESGQPRFDELSVSYADDKMAGPLYADGIRGHLIIPIQSDNKIYGFLNIGSPMSGVYLKKHLSELDAIARYLAKVHETVIYRHKIKVLSDQLEQLHLKFSSIENIRTLGELAGGVFHDLNNVIGAILGRSQLILQKTEHSHGDELIDRIIRDAMMIEKSALDSGEILKRLRQLARSEKNGRKETINLQELIDDSVEMIQPRWERLVERNGLKITLENEPVNDIFINAEPSELREVFTNLLLNALDAMPDGGCISIISRRFNNSVRITISDTGTGMPVDIVEKIFTPFFTTKGEKGTGLGLPLSRKIIENHNGTLDVHTVLGEGTSFIITLPLIDEIMPGKINEPQVRNNNQNLKILIAEDSPELQETMSEMLATEGYDVSKASNGEEVLRLCGKKRYDLLLTDLGLPGISGLELAKNIKSIDKNIKIILTSGWEINESSSDLKENGVDSYLAKPFKIDDIRTAIHELIDQTSK